MTDRRRFSFRIVLVVAAFTGGAAPLVAADEESGWSVAVTALQVETTGNDPDVVHIVRPASTEDVALEAEDSIGYRAEIRWLRPTWSWGLDFFSHRSDQEAGPLLESGTIPQTEFHFPTRRFSAGPAESLYYQVLEDTTIETWTADAFAERALFESDRSALGLRLGIKTTDFDNDYRAIGGRTGVAGLRIDASSNYDRMHGPLVGLAGRIDFGRSRFEGLIAQSVVFSSVELSVLYRDFAGQHDENGVFTNPQSFSDSESVTIPITDLRLRWSWRFTDRFAMGLAAEGAFWWDLPLPPGVVATDPPFASREEMVAFIGLGATISYRF